MTRRFIVRARAERDLKSTFEWYESQQSGLGDEFLSAVRERLETLRNFPESAPVLYRDIRRAVVSHFPYVIFYIVRRLWFRYSPSSISLEIQQSGHVGLVLHANDRSNGRAASGSRKFGVFAAARRSPRR